MNIQLMAICILFCITSAEAQQTMAATVFGTPPEKSSSGKPRQPMTSVGFDVNVMHQRYLAEVCSPYEIQIIRLSGNMRFLSAKCLEQWKRWTFRFLADRGYGDSDRPLVPPIPPTPPVQPTSPAKRTVRQFYRVDPRSFAMTQKFPKQTYIYTQMLRPMSRYESHRHGRFRY